jgi:hypothetical protein
LGLHDHASFSGALSWHVKLAVVDYVSGNLILARDLWKGGVLDSSDVELYLNRFGTKLYFALHRGVKIAEK